AGDVVVGAGGVIEGNVSLAESALVNAEFVDGTNQAWIDVIERFADQIERICNEAEGGNCAAVYGAGEERCAVIIEHAIVGRVNHYGDVNVGHAVQAGRIVHIHATAGNGKIQVLIITTGVVCVMHAVHLRTG